MALAVRPWGESRRGAGGPGFGEQAARLGRAQGECGNVFTDVNHIFSLADLQTYF